MARGRKPKSYYESLNLTTTDKETKDDDFVNLLSFCNFLVREGIDLNRPDHAQQYPELVKKRDSLLVAYLSSTYSRHVSR